MPADLSDHLAVAGTRVPSLTNLQALRSASQAMNSSIALIADALGNATLSQNVGFIAKRCTYNGRCLVPMYDCEAWLADSDLTMLLLHSIQQPVYKDILGFAVSACDSLFTCVIVTSVQASTGLQKMWKIQLIA